MNMNDKSTIERALGIIEGIATGLPDPVANMLITAVDMIESAVEKDGGG